MRLMAATLAAALALGGCSRLLSALHGVPRVPQCEVALPPSTLLASDSSRRLRIHVSADRVSEGYEVIVQARDGSVTLVGLTRFGAKAFTVVQTGQVIEVVSFLKPIEVVPPINILADVYRWPFDWQDDSGDVQVHVGDDGRSAVIVHHGCGYRTTIFDLTHGDGS